MDTQNQEKTFDQGKIAYKIGDTVIYEVSVYELRNHRKYIGDNSMSDNDILGNYFLLALTKAGLSLKDVSERGIEPVMKDLKEYVSHLYAGDLNGYFEFLIHNYIEKECKAKGISFTDEFMVDYFNLPRE